MSFEPHYTFDTFVITPYNEAAFNAAQGVVKELGTRYTPLFICGSSFSGKTHLLHAIANAIMEQGDASILSVKGKQFASDIAFALKKNKLKHKLTDFYHNYQKCDILLIDGFDALVGDDVAQNVTMRLFDAMDKKRQQVIVTAGMESHRFPLIEEYLRFSSAGMITDILAPEGLVKNRHLMLRD